jgi:hypothetical protein
MLITPTYFELVNFQANGRTAPAATALMASPIKNGTTPFAIAQAMVLPVVYASHGAPIK